MSLSLFIPQQFMYHEICGDKKEKPAQNQSFVFNFMPNCMEVSIKVSLCNFADRQKCAVWIKKLCEPPSSGMTGR